MRIRYRSLASVEARRAWLRGLIGNPWIVRGTGEPLDHDPAWESTGPRTWFTLPGFDGGPPHRDCDCMSCRPWTS